MWVWFLAVCAQGEYVVGQQFANFVNIQIFKNLKISIQSWVGLLTRFHHFAFCDVVPGWENEQSCTGSQFPYPVLSLNQCPSLASAPSQQTQWPIVLDILAPYCDQAWSWILDNVKHPENEIFQINCRHGWGSHKSQCFICVLMHQNHKLCHNL